MPADRERFDKVLAIAINPGSYEEEAISAPRKARELVKNDRSLAHLPPAPVAKSAPADQGSLEVKITHISPFWLNILLSNLSQEAYGLGLKSKLTCDFHETPTAVNVRCDGAKNACATFQAHLDWLIDYIDSQPPKTRS
jgi:hypothetical protein